jgi:hypothetical protein
MFKKFSLFAAVVAAFAFTCQAAEAGGKHPDNKKLAGVAIGVGAAAGAGYWALGNWKWKWENVNGITSAGAWGLTTVGCMAVSPMVATVVLDRPLTMREAHVLFGSCVVPLIGGWLVEQAYDAHPEWDPAYKAPRAKKMRHAKK